MTRIVTDELAKLIAVAGVVAVGLGVGVAPVWGLAVSVGMLALLATALISPAGPKVRFNVPGEQPMDLGLGDVRDQYLDGEINEEELEEEMEERLKE
ncbi:MAG: hypothetical protein HQRvContig02_22 [Haloquadratum phage sp.]|nr:MAG: hypothetical protein HQRvContig02_22 [Haloquadratum phage sp.]